jgi:ribonuclease HI
MAVVIRLSMNGQAADATHVLNRYLGIRTNNYAEYAAVITAVKFAHSLEADELLVMTDSQLVCEQVNGNWRCQHADLKPLRTEVRDLLQRLFPGAWEIRWQRRNANYEADALCTAAINWGRNQNPFTPDAIKRKRPGKIIDPFA